MKATDTVGKRFHTTLLQMIHLLPKLIQYIYSRIHIVGKYIHELETDAMFNYQKYLSNQIIWKHFSSTIN